MLTLVRQQAGFTLIEILLAMIIGSIITLGLSSTLVTLHKQSSILFQLYRLEQALGQALMGLEKDLRRAGFNGGNRLNHPVVISAYPDSMVKSCVIIRYDLNRNGTIEEVNDQDSELFGYRLVKQALEQQRGVNSCLGNGWEKLLDPAEITVTHFAVEWQRQAKAEYFTITLRAYWRGKPELNKTLIRRIRKLNQ